MGLPHDMDISGAVPENMRIDIGPGIVGEAHQGPPFVAVKTPRVEVPVAALFGALSRLFTPDDPQAVPGVDGQLRHPDVGSAPDERHVRAGRPAAARKPAVQANLIMAVV